jgi:CBS domain-containing protein
MPIDAAWTVQERVFFEIHDSFSGGLKKSGGFYTFSRTLKARNTCYMATVKDMLARKPGAVTIVSHSAVMEALQLMAEHNIGSVVVTDEEGTYLGIITERDYSRKVVLKGKNSTTTPVEEIMTTSLPAVSPKDTIEHCRQLMTSQNIRYLPVFSGNELIGIISMSDVVKETIAMQQQTIDHLQQYISL